MQIAILCGRLTKDVEIKTTKAGDKETTVGSFTLAVDDGYGDNKHTNFFPCSVFGKQAETMEKWCKKGTRVVLNCKPRQNSYKDNNGNNHSYINFIVQSFEFANGKNENSGSEEQAEQQQTAAPTPSAPSATPAPKKEEDFMQIPDELGDELPFQ